MSEGAGLQVKSTRYARRFARIAALLQAAWWLYTFVFIAQSANPKGDGMEWMAAFPFTMIFAVFVVPALLLSAVGRMPRPAAIFAAAGIAANAYIFAEIWQEFHH